MKQDYKNTKRPIPEADSEMKESFPGYPKYPASEDVFARMKEESDIDPEDPTRMKDPSEDMGEWNEKTFQEDLVGDDLDVPGSDSEMDIEQENNELEDEENNYYSLGGDNHDDLEENRGLD
jgi:hypothetical protein